ncbi:MAG: hypothetical protein EOS09_32425 [Mesorhizobium sp.]|nr:MAG: hypothetical protein EOS09_32425 [Mesorhizobium sp.]
MHQQIGNVGSIRGLQGFKAVDPPSMGGERGRRRRRQHWLRERPHQIFISSAGFGYILRIEWLGEMGVVERLKEKAGDRGCTPRDAQAGETTEFNDRLPFGKSRVQLDFKEFDIQRVEPQFGPQTPENFCRRGAPADIQIILVAREQPACRDRRSTLQFGSPCQCIARSDQCAQRRHARAPICGEPHNACDGRLGLRHSVGQGLTGNKRFRNAVERGQSRSGKSNQDGLQAPPGSHRRCDYHHLNVASCIERGD